MQLFHDEPILGRSCGNCNACCVILGVKEELNKPNYVACQHMCNSPEGGCGIYEKRPEPCRTFSCLWLSGHFGDENSRPDKIGLMLVAFEIKMGNYEYAVTAWATGEEVLENEKARYLLRKLAQIRPIIIRSQTKFQIYGNRREVEKISEQMQKVNENRLNIIETKL